MDYAQTVGSWPPNVWCQCLYFLRCYNIKIIYLIYFNHNAIHKFLFCEVCVKKWKIKTMQKKGIFRQKKGFPPVDNAQIVRSWPPNVWCQCLYFSRCYNIKIIYLIYFNHNAIHKFLFCEVCVKKWKIKTMQKKGIFRQKKGFPPMD